MRHDATFWHADRDTCIQHAIHAYDEEGRKPATIRHYYYKLLSSGALQTFPKFENSKLRAYQWVSALLTEARDEGLFPWKAVVDNGRRSAAYYSYSDIAFYAYAEAMSGYKLDPWRGQPGRVEIISEKDGLVDMIASYVERWRIPVRALDGFNSTTRNKELAERYKDGRNYTLLCCGDFDPSGILIPVTLKKKLNQYGSYPDIKRIALTQTDTLSLPDHAAIDISPENPHAKEFVKRYSGQKGYEIEALTPTQLKQKIEAAIAPYIDKETFQKALELERLVRAEVSKHLKRALGGYARQTLTDGTTDSSLSPDEQLRYFLSPDQYTTFRETGTVRYSIYGDEDEDEPA